MKLGLPRYEARVLCTGRYLQIRRSNMDSTWNPRRSITLRFSRWMGLFNLLFYRNHCLTKTVLLPAVLMRLTRQMIPIPKMKKTRPLCRRGRHVPQAYVCCQRRQGATGGRRLQKSQNNPRSRKFLTIPGRRLGIETLDRQRSKSSGGRQPDDRRVVPSPRCGLAPPGFGRDPRVRKIRMKRAEFWKNLISSENPILLCVGSRHSRASKNGILLLVADWD